MPEPLPLSYQWRMPVVVPTVALVVWIGLLARGGLPGWRTAAAVLVGLWAGLMVVVWLRTRAYLQIDGGVLTVRRFHRRHTIRGADLLGVREFRTPSGRSHRLLVKDGPVPRRVVVPTALFRGGHSTLFSWIRNWAPQAELDRRSRRSLESLQARGMVP